MVVLGGGGVAREVPLCTPEWPWGQILPQRDPVQVLGPYGKAHEPTALSRDRAHAALHRGCTAVPRKYGLSLNPSGRVDNVGLHAVP